MSVPTIHLVAMIVPILRDSEAYGHMVNKRILYMFLFKKASFYTYTYDVILSHLIPITKENIYFLKHLPPQKNKTQRLPSLYPPFRETDEKLKLPGLPYGDGAASVCEALKCKTCWMDCFMATRQPTYPPNVPLTPQRNKAFQKGLLTTGFPSQGLIWMDLLITCN